LKNNLEKVICDIRQEYRIGLMLVTFAAVEVGLTTLAFSPRKKQIHGDEVGWKCEYPGCEKDLSNPEDQEWHHKVPVARGRRLGWTGAQINSVENEELDCIDHHLARHEELGDSGGVAWIKNRMRQKSALAENLPQLERRRVDDD
jgi:hypothetical protein